MKKSTYSIILSDRVVAEIDRLAYLRGTSRSALINEILAEHVSLMTPEKRISGIFDTLAELLYPGEIFRELAPPTPSIMSMRSALTYKYNPTVRYTVELYRDPTAAPGGAQGVIRVSVRSTNPALLAELHRFYRLWAGVEQRYGFPGEPVVRDHVLYRPILVRHSPLAGQGGEEDRPGVALAAFISLMDTGMKLCFREPQDDVAFGELSRQYEDYLKENGEVV